MKVINHIPVKEFSVKHFAEIAEWAEDENVFVILAKLPKKRSLRQNRYYWGVVLTVISDFLGYSKEEVHEILKLKFNLQTRIVVGEVYEFGGPTKQLDTKEFTDYLEKVREFSSSTLKCYVPNPNEVPLELYIEATLD